MCSVISGSDTSPAYLAEGEFNVRKLLLKRLVHVLLQVGWFHIFYNGRLGDERRSGDQERFGQKQKGADEEKNSYTGEVCRYVMV